MPSPITATVLISILMTVCVIGILVVEIMNLRNENTYLKNNQIIIDTVQTLMAEDIKPCDL